MLALQSEDECVLDESVMAQAELVMQCGWTHYSGLCSFKGEACHFCSTSGAERNCYQMDQRDNINLTSAAEKPRNVREL